MKTDRYAETVHVKWDELTDLEDGTRFPMAVEAILMPRDATFAMTMTFKVEDGRPKMTHFSVSCVDGPLNATDIHAIPVKRVAEETVEDIAERVAVIVAQERGKFSIDPQPASANAGRLFARKGVRRSDEDLRRIAEMVRSNTDEGVAKVMLGFHVAERTAYRYIAEARARGFLEKGE